MSNYEVREKQLTPDEIDLLQAWIDDNAKQPELPDDGFRFFHGLVWGLSLGLLMWSLAIWLFS